MKKTILAILLILIVSLSACSLLSDYLPGTTGSNGTGIVLNDSFVFTNESDDANLVTGAVVGPPLRDDEDEEVQEVDENQTQDEMVEEEVDEESDTQLDDLVLATITATEGDLVSLDSLVAEDPDGDRIEYSYEEPFNDDGLWQTDDGDEGKYLVSITASDGVLSTSENVQVVILASNKAPVIDCPENFEVAEGELIELPCTIYDKEGDEVSFTVSGFMDDLTYQTGFDDAGEYTVTITASDGARTSTAVLPVIVTNTNRAPVVEGVDDITAMEGDLISLELDVEDADGDELTVAYPLVFEEDGAWQTERGDAGTYELEAVVTDGEASVKVPINVEIEKVNAPPTLEPFDPIVVNEGEKIILPIDIEDLDGDDLEIEITGFMTSAVYTTTFDDAGEHEVTVKVTDGKATAQETVSITVNDVNRPPIFLVK